MLLLTPQSARRSRYANPEADWLARSAGATLATDWRTDEEVTGPGGFTGEYRWANGMNSKLVSQVHRYTEDGITGGSCLRIWWEPTDGTSAAWHRALDPTWTDQTQGFGLGVEWWMQFRFKFNAARLNNSLEKFCIIANHDTDNPVGGANQSSNRISHVLTSGGANQFPQPYRHTNSFQNGAAWDVEGGTPASALGGGEFNLLPGFDRGPAFGGVPKDPGYTDRFCVYPSRTGCPHWANDFPPDEWHTVMSRILINQWGSVPSTGTGNEWDVWMARKDATAWTPIISVRDYTTGTPSLDGFPGGFNGVWFTGRTASGLTGASENTWFLYDQLIVKTGSAIALPAVGC